MLFCPVYFGKSEILSRSFQFYLLSPILDCIKRALYFGENILKFSLGKFWEIEHMPTRGDKQFKVLYFSDDC